MQETLDKLAIELCENLPLDFTLYERGGFCGRPNKYCEYCWENGKDTYLCNKKTYTPSQELRFVWFLFINFFGKSRYYWANEMREMGWLLAD